MPPKATKAAKSNRTGKASPPTKGVAIADEAAIGSSATVASDTIQPTGESTDAAAVYVTTAKLKMREGSELSSAEAGFVQKDTHVCVIETKTLEDGAKRQCLANEGETKALGWVTALNKDGSPNLSLVAAPPAAVTPAPPRPAPTPPPAAPTEDVSPPPKKTGSTKKSGSAKKSSRTEDGGNKEKPSTKKGDKVAKATKDTVPVLTSAEVREQTLAISKEADDLEATIDDDKKTLKVLIGESLIRTNAKISELVQSWAKGGTGAINKMDFRKHIRKVVDNPNIVEVDALFGELDDDGGGTLDVGELKAAFKKLQQEVAKNSELAGDVRSKVAVLRERAAAVEAVADVTELAEKAEARLAEIRDNVSVHAKLGALIIKRNLKIDATFLASWTAANGEKRGDGEVDCTGFRVNVRNMGLPEDVADAEIDGLFGELDSDGGGTLDFKELQASLRKLQDASSAADAELVKLKKSTVEDWKQARAQQAELKRKQKALEQERLEAEKRLEEDKLKAEAEAKAAKEAKLSAQKAAKEAKEKEKAEFDAKIAARRAEQG